MIFQNKSLFVLALAVLIPASLRASDLGEQKHTSRKRSAKLAFDVSESLKKELEKEPSAAAAAPALARPLTVQDPQDSKEKKQKIVHVKEREERQREERQSDERLKTFLEASISSREQQHLATLRTVILTEQTIKDEKSAEFMGKGLGVGYLPVLDALSVESIGDERRKALLGGIVKGEALRALKSLHLSGLIGSATLTALVNVVRTKKVPALISLGLDKVSDRGLKVLGPAVITGSLSTLRSISIHGVSDMKRLRTMMKRAGFVKDQYLSHSWRKKEAAAP